MTINIKKSSPETLGIFQPILAQLKHPWMKGLQRARTMNGEIGPVTDKNYEIWNCPIIVI